MPYMITVQSIERRLPQTFVIRQHPVKWLSDENAARFKEREEKPYMYSMPYYPMAILFAMKITDKVYKQYKEKL